MKNLFLLLALVTVSIAGSAQKNFSTSTAVVRFIAQDDKDIDAINKKAVCRLQANGDLSFIMLMKDFSFDMDKMQEHFNEEYVESEKYPRASFIGTIQNIKSIDFTKDGKYTAKVVGTLTMHGVTKPVQTSAILTIGKGKIVATATMSINMSDFKIDASAVTEKVDLEINCNYTQL